MPMQFPVISLGAEYAVMGSLMRRNILTYKAPPGNEGYDLICIHPNPQKVTRQIRVQVKSRYQTDCDRGFPVKAKSLSSFDYLVIVFQNLGYYYRKRPILEGKKSPEFYTLPADFIRQYHQISPSGWEKVMTRGLNLDPFANDTGFELIAKDLGIPYPGTQADFL